MNKNKGIIGIGLILAIVLVVAVIGGGTYYLGKSKGESREVKIEENNTPQENTVVENNSVKAVTLDMSNELARTYTTAFTNALKQPANFDGHYVVASWGCGSGCLSYGIVDKLTGKVYQAPGDDYGNIAGYSGDVDFNANRWLVSSNIFKAIGRTSIDTYKFENEKFTKIDSNPFQINSGTETSTISKNGITVTIPKNGFTYDTNVAHAAGNSAVALNVAHNDKIVVSIYKWNNKTLFAESVPDSRNYQSVDMNYSLNGLPAQYYKLLYRGESAIIVPSKLTQIQFSNAEFIGITQSELDQIVESIKIN